LTVVGLIAVALRARFVKAYIRKLRMKYKKLHKQLRLAKECLMLMIALMGLITELIVLFSMALNYRSRFLYVD
jgi:hypothetical protein